MASRVGLPIMVVLVSMIGACAHPADRRAETADLDRAVAIALEALDGRGRTSSDVKLVGASQLVLEGRYVWRVTFKPLHLLPDDPSRGKIGAGGEVFVNVDLGTGMAVVRWGE